jgi:ectoine hydroxylase-related dioxygenase (phytanoyl-CoA dioxygenase family)
VNNYWAFLPMRDSNDLLGDADALRARFDDDSYLYFRQVLDREKLTKLRQRMLVTLADHGWVRRSPYMMRGVTLVPPVREGDEDFLRVYDDVQRLEEFHTLAHDETLVDIMRQVLGESAFPHPLKIARLGFPEHYEVSTPPHQDYPNNQGTPNLTAAWIPVGDCPTELGGLAILRGSHHYGVLELDTHLGPGNRKAVLPERLLEEHRWVTTDYAAGDVLLFRALTVHAALHNASEFFMRLSVDFRYQLEGEELTAGCLLPHFERLSWDEIYAGWRSKKYQYYWKGLDYRIVPFREFPLVRSDASEWEDVQAFLAYERRRDRRFERRTERLTAMLEPD